MVLSLLALGGQSFADLCTIDAVPAATLLLPHFQVDIGDADGDGSADGGGVNTLFSINNASAAPALAHVTLWTDWSVPTVDFDIFLTGYDVVTINLFEVIANGNIPITADEQSDAADTISPHGDPSWDGSFTNCNAFFPFFNNPVISGSILDRLQNGHSGYPVATLGGDCMGQDLNGAGSCAGGSCPAGTIARGYITVDNVNECSTDFPNDPLYFGDGGTGIASNVNQLWGDWFMIDDANDFAQGDNLVHVEADDLFNATSTPTNYTFYGRYTQALGGIDNREPLGTTWAFRYFTPGTAFDGGTNVIAWRDSTANQLAEAFTCGIGPDWNPLNEVFMACFNESEDPVELCFSAGGGVISPPTDPLDTACFPLETNNVAMDQGALSVPFNSGWCYLNLNIPSDTITADVDFPAVPPGDIAQSYVSVIHSALGQFSVGLQAIELSSACDDVNDIIVLP